MKPYILLFLLPFLSFSPVREYEIIMDVCKSEISPLIALTPVESDSSKAHISCVNEDGQPMMYGFQLSADKLEFKVEDKKLSKEDAYTIFTASDRVAEMDRLEIISITKSTFGFEVKCRYKDQEGLIVIGGIRENKED